MNSEHPYIQSFPDRDLFLKAAMYAIYDSKNAFLIYKDVDGELFIHSYSCTDHNTPLSYELYGQCIQLKNPTSRVYAKSKKYQVPNPYKMHFLRDAPIKTLDAKSAVLIVDDANVLSDNASNFLYFGLPEQKEALFDYVWEAYQEALTYDDDEDSEEENFN